MMITPLAQFWYGPGMGKKREIEAKMLLHVCWKLGLK